MFNVLTALRARTKFKIGDSVVVKPGIVDSDTGGLIGGWQGRITEIDEKAHLILISWDSITLRDMSDDAIAECEEKGMDWRCYYLGFDDVEPGSPRDKQEDVEAMVELRGSEHEWTYLGEEGKRIQAVLDKAEDDSEWAAFEAWEEHLGDVLKFPFVAEVSESLGRGPM